MSKLGIDPLFLNTAFAAPQITEVSEASAPWRSSRRRIRRSIAEAGQGRWRFVAWADPGEEADDPTLDELIARGRSVRPRAPGQRAAS